MALPPTQVIVNPAAANGRAGRLWPTLRRELEALLPAGWQAAVTSGPGQAPDLAAAALAGGARLLVVVGGDGTLNEVVNGLYDGQRLRAQGVSLALVPLGTGGDYRKTFGLDSDWRAALARLRAGAPHPVDLGRLTCAGRDGAAVTRHFANITSFGASGLIDEKVNATTKVLGGRVSFLIGTLRGLAAYRNQGVRLTVDDQAPRELAINTVAVAIGQCFGGGMRVAARARPDDGLFDVVVISTAGVLSFVRNARHLYRGTHLDLPGIELLRGARVRAEPLGAERVLIDMDGETPGQLPATLTCLERPISLWY